MPQKINFKFLFLGFLLFACFVSNAQDPNRFKEQVDRLYNEEYNFSNDKKLVVFTGSSSIVMWKDVADYYPQYNVINNGFGGSHFSDMLYFYDKVITKQTPDILFIYEGDNDVAGDKKTKEIYVDFKMLVGKLKTDLPNTRVIFISPKPSIARWNMKKDYDKINKKMSKYCSKKKINYEFADMWKVMLDETGNVYQDIFIEDGLHMNKKGYDIWGEAISKYLN